MKKIMAIFAHPDDEGAIAGTLAMLAEQGDRVTLVCATRGEVGQISDPALATPETLGQVRERELTRAADIIGIAQLIILDYRDSGMAGTPENEDPRALVRADPAEFVSQLLSLLQAQKPDAVITFEPFGWYGHPDHLFVSKWVTAAFTAALNKADELGPDSSWRPAYFYYAGLPISQFREMFAAALEAGFIEEGEVGFDIPEEEIVRFEAMITHRIDVSAFVNVRRQAMSAHQTQFSADSVFRKVPEELLLQSMGVDYFVQVYPVLLDDLDSGPLPSLFNNP